MTEYQLSQWISQALAGELSEQQRSELQAALERSPASQVFAEWSSRIQAAAAQGERDMDAEHPRTFPESSEALSELSKERMRRVLRAVQTGYHSISSQQQYLLVAQPPATYSNSRPAESPSDSTPPDNQELPQPPIQPPDDS